MSSVYKNNRAGSKKSHLGMSVGGWLLGGLGVGAIVMYFLDPDAGANRREGAARLASQSATRLASHAGEHFGKVRDTVRNAIHADSVSDAIDQITEALPVQEEESSSCSFMPMAITAIACSLLGAGVMYVLDPDSGRRRRGYLRDQAGSSARGAADYLSHKSQHLKNKAQGMYHDAAQTIKSSRLAGLAGGEDNSQ